MVESVAKLQAEIKALSGVDIMLDKDNFKSTYQIMDELSAKWKDLSDIAQATIIELIAGKHQGNVIASLMENFDTAREALDTSLNSSGSAMEEHAKWSESLEARLLKLQASWQNLSQTFLSSDFLAFALDSVIALVDGLTALIDTFGAFPTIMAAVAAGFSLFKNKGFFTFDKENKSIQLLGINLSKLKSEIGKASTVIKTYNSNLNKSAGVQNAYVKAIGHHNAAFGKYLTGLKGAKASMGGYIASLVAGKVATLALRAATTLMNAALTMGVSLIAEGLISAVMSWINAESELAEKVEEVTDKYKEQHKALMDIKGDYDTSNEDSMISKYEELSKGVDSLGRNVSLTADEYSEYQDIVNTIADQIPSLVSGYDDQGNAILSVKGNVEELTAAYQELIHAQNQQILTKNGKDIEEDWKNTIAQAKEYDELESLGNSFMAGFGLLGFDLSTWDMKYDTVKALAGLTAESTKDEINQKLLGGGAFNGWGTFQHAEVVQALQQAGVDIDLYSDTAQVIQDLLKEDPDKIRNIVSDYYAQLDVAVSEYKEKARAFLSEAFDVSSEISGLDYSNISEELQAVAYDVVNGLDFDFLNNLTENGITIDQWVKKMLDQLNALSSSEVEPIETAFELQTQFNGGDISYGQYVRNLEEVKALIDNLNIDDTVKDQLKLSLNIDDEGAIKQYENLINRLTDLENYDFAITEDEARKFLDGLTSEELSIATKIITEMSNNDVYETIDQIRNAIDREVAINGLGIEITVEAETTKLEAFATALSESVSGSGLSSTSISAIEDMYGSLADYDKSKLFERTANGIRLNSEEVRKLNSEYKEINLAEINKEMSSLGDIYNQTREELYHLAYGTDEYNDKASDLSKIEAQINSLEQLATSIKGVYSAYQEWQMAESAGSQRDMYENVITGLKGIDDEIKRGWYDDATIEFLELLTGQDLSTAGIDKVKKAYQGLSETIENTTYSVRDFFTVDDSGNSTNAGVYNFLDAIGQMEEEAFGGKDVVKRKDGNIIGFDFQVVGGDEVIAEALGISEELVQIMVRAADDAGFVVSIDGTYQQLDVLKEKAQEAAESLNQILGKNGKKGFNFDFNSTDVEDIKTQLTSAKKILDDFRNTDGTINTKLEGADEALTVASTLQSMLDKLSRPTYMTLETNQVEENLQNPLESLQELRRLTETEHQLKLSGADTSQLKEDREEIYQYFEELDPKIKAEIGLVDEKGNALTGDALKDKLNSGDVAIEATVDIQLEMDEKLGILVDKALLEAGIIDKKEFEKRVAIYLKADVDNEDAKNKTEQAVNEVASGGAPSSSKDGKTSDKKVETKVDVEVKADNVDTSNVTEKVNETINNNGITNEPATGADGRKAGMGIDVEVTVDEVDTSEIAEKTEEAINNETSEALAVETKVELETTINEASELIEKFEDKDITIDVTVKGIEDVKELNTNIDLATEIDGDIENLSKYVEGAKTLSELDDDIATYITANIGGNLIDKSNEEIEKLKILADSSKELKDGSITSNITANTLGNIFEDDEKDIDNLKVFVDSSKGIKDIEGDIVSNITANTLGSVFEGNEDSIDNLKTFVESAQGIKDIKGDITSNITANTLGSVFEDNEDSIDNLKTYIESAKGIKDIEGDITSNITANTLGSVFENNEDSIDNLKTFVDSAQGVKDVEGDIVSNITANTLGNVFTDDERNTDNIKVFIDSAKGIKDIEGDITSNITANTLGNVFTDDERNTDNLKTFVESANGIKDIEGDIVSNITANTLGNVFTDTEDSINNLKTFVDSAKGIKDIEGDIVSNITADIKGNVVDTAKERIDNLKTFTDSAKNVKDIGEDVKAKVTANVSGDVIDTEEYKLNNLKVFISSAKNIKSIEGNISSSVTADVQGNVINTSEDSLENLGVFANSANKLKDTGDITSSVSANASGNAITDNTVTTNLEHFKSVVSGMTDHTVTVKVAASVDSAKVNEAITILSSVASSGVFKDYNATVKVGATIATIDDAAVQNYQAPKKEGTVEYTVDSTIVDNWKAPHKTGEITYTPIVQALTEAQKNKTGTITYKANVEGAPVVNGTANINGTASGRAFAHGDWGTKTSGVALMGELGRENFATIHSDMY